MNRLLEQAIEAVRRLPKSDQEEAAELLFALAEKAKGTYHLSEDELAAVERGIAAADRGEFASDEEMEDFFKRHGA